MTTLELQFGKPFRFPVVPCLDAALIRFMFQTEAAVVEFAISLFLSLISDVRRARMADEAVLGARDRDEGKVLAASHSQERLAHIQAWVEIAAQKHGYIHADHTREYAKAVGTDLKSHAWGSQFKIKDKHVCLVGVRRSRFQKNHARVYPTWRLTDGAFADCAYCQALPELYFFPESGLQNIASEWFGFNELDLIEPPGPDLLGPDEGDSDNDGGEDN